MSDELNWLKTEAGAIERENRKLKERVRQLEWQLDTADADRNVMARQLIALKREKQRFLENASEDAKLRALSEGNFAGSREDDTAFSPLVKSLLPPHLQASSPRRSSQAADRCGPPRSRTASREASPDSSSRASDPRLGRSKSSDVRTLCTDSSPTRSPGSTASSSSKSRKKRYRRTKRRTGTSNRVSSARKVNPWSPDQDIAEECRPELSIGLTAQSPSTECSSTGFPRMGENSRAYAQAAPVTRRTRYMASPAPRHQSSVRPRTALKSSTLRPGLLAKAQSYPAGSPRMPSIAAAPAVAVYRPITSATVTPVSASPPSARTHRPRTALSARPHRPQAPHVVSMLANHPLSARRRARCLRADRRPSSARHHGYTRGSSVREDSPDADEEVPSSRLAAREALDCIGALLRTA